MSRGKAMSRHGRTALDMLRMPGYVVGSHERHTADLLTEQMRLGIEPSARQWFDYVRPRLLNSRPVTVVAHPHKTVTPMSKDGKRKLKPRPVEVQVFGAPTFRNAINSDGVLV